MIRRLYNSAVAFRSGGIVVAKRTRKVKGAGNEAGATSPALEVTGPAHAVAPGAQEPREIPEIKLVAVDLDGTLLNDSKQVSEQTIAALRCLPTRGVKLVIASAR